MRSKEGKTLLLGLGNIMMGDEGASVHVLREVEKRTLPAGVECLDGGTGGLVLLQPLQNAGRIVMIDAAADSNAIGTVTRITPRFSKDYRPTITSHDFGIKDLLDAFYILGGDCDRVLNAITIEPHQSISLYLSTVVAKAAAKTVERIVAELESFARTGTIEPVDEACGALYGSCS